MSDIQALKTHASGRWLSILQTLAPQLSQACEHPGQHFPCPTHGGKDGFRLFRDVAETGGGVCNTCGAFADGFDLLQWMNGWTFSEAVDAVQRTLGLDNGYIPPKRTTPKPLPEKDWESQRQWLQKLWDEAIPNRQRLKQYLEYRGLSVDPPASLRFHEGLKYFDDQKRSLGTFPCMIAKIIRGHDLVGLHVTFLNRDDLGKADVPTPKKIWKCTDSISGGSIHLFDPAGPDDTLALVEGIETGLAVRELTGFSVFACGNAILLEQVEIPNEIYSIYIGADRDRSKTGELAAYNLADRLFRKGVTARITYPPMEIPEGKKSVDWLDYLVQKQEVANG
ncbi:MAG: toprim domain-containing protein [Nitrospinae bacterium]|nr:toprim domain-containing protein [Nitrospinota bacterium]